MFEGFANVWTPVLSARDLRDEARRVRVAGEAIVLFRDEGGEPGARLDRPSPSEVVAVEERLPAREALSLVWIFTGHEAPPEGPTLPSIDPVRPLVIHAETWPAPFSRVVSALQDPANLPFTWALGDAPAERALEFHAPGCIEYFLPPRASEKRTLVYCFPESERATRVLFCATRAPGDGPVPSWITEYFAATDLARERACEPTTVSSGGGLTKTLRFLEHSM
ncbi:hypothetical protein [Polyangium spumosum]|uniref:Rieske domain-containing protein n=1 Tax=Polyangium spumosum TaxID=889282 RepID=A0A6N7PZX7_9BACT|nr:hypothetical protein [Polyangium spumosum]MRG97409.1 hypothetical protein [Polyangium spumosum]